MTWLHYLRYKIKYYLLEYLKEQINKTKEYLMSLSIRKKKPFAIKFDGFEFNGIYHYGSILFFIKNDKVIIFKGKAKKNNGRWPMWYRKAEIRFYIKKTRLSTLTIEYAIYRDELYKDFLSRNGRKTIVTFLKKEKDLEFMENLEDLLS